MKMKLATAAILLTLTSAAVWAQVNAGQQTPETTLPFNMTTVTTFTLPWRLAFLPDGRMLVTEKVGPVWLVTQQGQKTMVGGTPATYWQGQSGMLGVYVSPSRQITPRTRTSTSRIPNRGTTAAAWRWRARG